MTVVRKRGAGRSTRFEFDPRIFRLVQSVGVSRDAAWEALSIAADYMERDEKLPRELAVYIAGAIRGALAARLHKNLVLAKGLGLASGHRKREGGDAITIGHAMAQVLDDGASENAAAQEVGRRFRVSSSTAKRRLREYLEIRRRVDSEE